MQHLHTHDRDRAQRLRVAVLFGAAIRREQTQEAFSQRLHPCVSASRALPGRERVSARSTLSRWLATLPLEPVKALRMLQHADLLARPAIPEDA